MAGAKERTKSVEMTTGIGVISFPHLFEAQANENKNDKGVPVYDCQFLIPKSDKDTARAILAAIKEVGEAKWGKDVWKQFKNPLRDGDKEAALPTEDGSTRGEKYPERLGHWFINARSQKPIGVVDRQRVPITDHSRIYAGCMVKVAVSFYVYSNSGNTGIGCGLNGVQFIRDGEPIAAGGKPAVESMFDMLDDEELGDDDLDGLDADLEDEVEEEEVEETPPPAKKAAAKKAPAKKAAAKKKAAPVEVEEEDEDLLDDLDDLE